MKNIYKNACITFILALIASMAFAQQNMLADIPNQDPNNPVYAYVEKMPALSGGVETLKMYADYYPYPECGLENKLEGKVILQFIVEINGEISDIKVVREKYECCG